VILNSCSFFGVSTSAPHVSGFAGVNQTNPHPASWYPPSVFEKNKKVLISLCAARRLGCACRSVLQCAAVCCSVLECVAVCWSVLQCVAVCWSVLQCVAVCCSVLQCVAVCCSVLQCVAVCCSVLQCSSQCVEVCCRLSRLWVMGWLPLVGSFK